MGDVVPACSLLSLHGNPIPLPILSASLSLSLPPAQDPAAKRDSDTTVPPAEFHACVYVHTARARDKARGAETFRWRAVTRDTIFSRQYISACVSILPEIYPRGVRGCN